MKLRSKIGISFLLITSVITVVIFFIVRYFAQDFIINSVYNYNASILESKGNSISRNIYSRLERWETYAENNSALKEFIINSNNKFDQMNDREDYIKNQDEIWVKDYEGGDKNFIDNITDNSLSTALRDRIQFFQARYEYSVFTEAFVVNKYGVVIAQNHKVSDYNQSDEEWLVKTKNQGVYISDVIYDESSKSNALEFCIRIDDSEGNFLGVLKVIYNIEDIFQIINEIIQTPVNKDLNEYVNLSQEKTHIYLLDKKGRLIYSDTQGFGNFIDKSLYLENLKIESGKRSISKVFSENGEDKLFIRSYILDYMDFKYLSWSLVVSKNNDLILASWHKISNYLVLILFLLFLAIMMLSFILAQYLTKSINKLIEGMRIIESGNLNYKVRMKSKDEIGQLSQSFEKMIRAIKKSRLDLDMKVKKQTEEIVEKAKNLEEQRAAILNILEDVEEEKEKTLEEKEKIYTILHSIGDGVFVVDKDLKVILTNYMVEKISGFSSGEILGRKYSDVLNFIRESDKKKIKNDFIKESMEKERIEKMPDNTMLIRKNGEIIPVADSVAPIRNKDKEVIGCVVVFRDITKDYQIDKAKTEFVSLASHQLRTPLSAINWYAEMLLSGDAGKLNKDQKSFVNEIYIGNQRMVELVNALLNVSRIELGTLAIDPKIIDFKEISKNVIKELKEEIKRRNIEVRENYSRGLPKIKADPNLSRIILQNIITNAIKYTPEKGTVNVLLKKDKDNLIIQISDTGYGIPKDQQDKIFQKLFRADNVREKDTGGTGLGLYLVKSILDQSGGKVWFESKENKGTTFFVHIPLSGMKKKEGSKTLN